MNINTRDMNFVKFNNQIMNFVNFNGVEVYSAGYWLTKTGYPCVLTNSLGKTLRDYKIYGNSEQDDCEENQLNIAMTPTTLNGITSTKLDDGSYQFTGTSTASTTFRSVNIYSNRKLYKAGTYYIPDEITIDNVVLGLNFTTASSGGTLKQIQINSNSGRTFTLDNDYYLAQWYIWFKSANTNYDFNFFPQITKEDITEHKPYVSIPTQENPSEIKSVGDYDSTTGKYKIPIKVETLNICKSNRLNTTTIYGGVTQTIDENGVITLNGTSTAVSFPSYASTKSFFLPKGTYTLCGNMTGRGIAEDGSEVVFPFHIQEDDSGNAKTLGASSTSPVRFTTTQDWNCKMYIYINKKNVTFDNVKYYPMLVKGSYTADDMLEFEPYKEPILSNVYLEEPLRKVGDYADYIDFKNQKIVRNVKVNDDTGTMSIEESYSQQIPVIEEDIILPEIETFKETNVIETDTTISPSNIEVVYKSSKKEA